MARPLSSKPEHQRSRGPRNRRPVLLRFTALFHLLTRLAFYSSLVGIPVAALHDPRLIHFVAAFPLVIFIFGAVWLLGAFRVGCRVCAMRMFLNKRCAKSPKAPNWWPLGPHTTLAVLALFARSVRCPYCGTPNDLSDPDSR